MALLLLAIIVPPISAQDPSPVSELTIEIPDFQPYEAEYGSAFGRFFNRAWPYVRDGRSKLSVVNTITTPNGIIVDSRSFDRTTLQIDYMMSPYFAWAEEYVVALFGESGFQWTRIPIGGGDPITLRGESDAGPFVDDLGFSPAFAGLLPLPVGRRFTMPVPRPIADGTVGSRLLEFEVVGTASLELSSGFSCECTVLEQTGPGDSVTRFWVSREPPFVYRRHRDIGGPRDFVSELLDVRRFPAPGGSR